MLIITVRVEKGNMLDRKPWREPCLCLLRVWVCLNKASLWSEFSISGFNWWRTRSFFSVLNYIFMLKMPSPHLQMDSWTMILSSLCHSWGNFKIFFLSILRYFVLIKSRHVFDYVKMNTVLEMTFSCSVMYPIPVIICSISVGNKGHHLS